MCFKNTTGKEKIFDAYCGIGTIGLVASDKAKEVIGVELNADAVKDAKINAKLNEKENISFYCDDAGKFMVAMAREREKVDVLFMDPPRAGSDLPFLKSVAILQPKKVVYVSCDSATLARDLRYLCDGGYVLDKVCPVDQFPGTVHVETVTLLQRVK